MGEPSTWGETRTPGHWGCGRACRGSWDVSPLSSPPPSPSLRVWVSVPRAGPAVDVITSISPSTSAHRSDVPFGQQSTAPLQERSWKTSCAVCGLCLSFLGASQGPENPPSDHEPGPSGDPSRPSCYGGCRRNISRDLASQELFRTSFQPCPRCMSHVTHASLFTVLIFTLSPHVAVFTSSLRGL